VKWLCATVAPWALGGGLLVSFTASAGNDARAGHSIRPLGGTAVLVEAGALVPPAGQTLRDLIPASAGTALRAAALRLDLPDALETLDRGMPPRDDLKDATQTDPDIDRSGKGDPIVPLRPTVSRRGVEVLPKPGLHLGPDERRLPPTVLMRGETMPPDLFADQTFEPWHEERTTTQRATAEQSPLAASQGSTGIGRAGGITTGRDGATPGIGRAQALASATPAAADWTPVEVAAAPVSLPVGSARQGLSAIAKGESARPRYAEMIDPESMGREQRCLAEAVYFEARSEPEDGQAAVAQVVLNRVRSGLYPSSICGVVYQNRHRHLACQFTFACEGKALRVTESDPWRRAVRVANAVLQGTTYLEDVGASTHYHANYVRPRWARKLKKMDVIGRHIFYKLRPGQT
jgi:hypothetical protein